MPCFWQHPGKAANQSSDPCMQLPIASARFVAVSATIPNVQDIAEWLGADPLRGGLHVFGEDHRPVRLVTHVRGYAMTKVRTPTFPHPQRNLLNSFLKSSTVVVAVFLAAVPTSHLMRVYIQQSKYNAQYKFDGSVRRVKRRAN